MTERYDSEIKELIANTDFILNQTFDISVSPNVEEFSNTFNFYRDTLTNATKFGIESSYIFFYNDTSKNAKAGISKGYNIILIHSGLIISLIQNLLEKSEIDEIIKKTYPEVQKLLDNPANILIYQAAQHFTFYHELGHLIQKPENLKDFISERPTESEKFDFLKHKLEFDADTFSALNIAAHIHQYAFNIFGEKIDAEKVESIIEIFCSGILLYFLSFESFKDGIYYEEGSHPHPTIRMLNVVLVITHYCRQSPRILEREITINHLKIFERTIDTAMKIEQEAFQTSKSSTFVKTLGEERKKLVGYYGKLRDYSPDGFISAENRWNESLKK